MTKDNKETILILGATGNVASLVAKLLDKSKHANLRLTSSRENGVEKLAAQFPQTEVMQADWNSLPSMKKAFDGVSRALIITPDFYTDEQVVSQNILDAAKYACTVRQLVKMIAIPENVELADFTEESLATRSGANLSIIAKPIFEGSGMPFTFVNVKCWISFTLLWFFAENIKQHSQFSFPDIANYPRRYINEGDIAEFIVKVMSDAYVGKELVITGEHNYDFNDIAKELSNTLGREINYHEGEKSLREIMQDDFPTIMNYLKHERTIFQGVSRTNTFEEIMERKPASMSDYILLHKEAFI